MPKRQERPRERAWDLDDLLKREHIDADRVLVLRHTPPEADFNKVLPSLALERPDVFNAYQQTQGKLLQGAMSKVVGTGYVASFIGHKPGKALFVGLYSIAGARPITFEEFWKVPACVDGKRYGMKGWTKEDDPRDTVLWFDLALRDFCAPWKGKLVVGWPPPEKLWWRRAHRNTFPIMAILEDSALEGAMPEWKQIDFTWEFLSVLPARWKTVLSGWRAVYYIFDTSDGKGYVGSACGEANLLGRWLTYAADGHGGNRLLRPRNPRNLRFTILERVSPDMDPSDVTRLEETWKDRLHTRWPSGLNDTGQHGDEPTAAIGVRRLSPSR